MWEKIWTIAWKDIIRTYTDRTLLLIMLVTPVALSTIIALAFSDVGGDTGGFDDIPVAIVNQDTGTETLNAGEIIVSALIPDAAATDASEACEEGESAAPTTEALAAEPEACEVELREEEALSQLTDAELLDDVDAARAAVDNGDYAAAIIIPANYSESLQYTQDDTEFGEVTLEVYANSGAPISGSIIRSITEGFVNQTLTGQIAVAATIETMVARAQTDIAFGAQFLGTTAGGNFNPDFANAFDPSYATVSVEQQTVTGEEQEDFNALVVIGSAQAVFFALFTASGGATGILEERRNWTLQRLIVSPTPRIVIMLGKLVGVFAAVLLQLIFLVIAFTVVGTLLEGELTLIWGSNIPALALLIIVTALAASGVGMITAALAKNAEQANIIGGVVAIMMGLFGGAFFTIDALPGVDILTRLSIVRWGSEGFTKLANGQADLFINIVALLIIGAILFGISLVAFNRREDI